MRSDWAPVPTGPERSESTELARPTPPGEMAVSEDASLQDVVSAAGAALARFGALIAVDGDGILRGVVTAAHLQRAAAPSGGGARAA